MREQLLESEVAIVTGGASGIGRAIARRFADEGAAVVVADVDSEAGRRTVAETTDAPGEIHFVETDVSDRADVDSLVAGVVDRFDGVDVLVNNAGGSIDDDNLHRIGEETWDRNVDVNLKGTFLCSKAALEPMVATGGGRMIHMSSVNALTGIGLTAYSAAKGGIISFSRVLAAQYAAHGIRSNVLCPGTIATERREEKMRDRGSDDSHETWTRQYPAGRFGRPEEVADAALYLASDLSSFVTGTKLVVDGGLTAGLDQELLRRVYDIDESPIRADDGSAREGGEPDGSAREEGGEDGGDGSAEPSA